MGFVGGFAEAKRIPEVNQIEENDPDANSSPRSELKELWRHHQVKKLPTLQYFKTKYLC